MPTRNIHNIIPSGAVDGINAAFYTPDSFAENTLRVFKNGLQEASDNFSIAGPDKFVLNDVPLVNCELDPNDYFTLPDGSPPNNCRWVSSGSPVIISGKLRLDASASQIVVSTYSLRNNLRAEIDWACVSGCDGGSSGAGLGLRIQQVGNPSQNHVDIKYNFKIHASNKTIHNKEDNGR